MNQEPSRNAVHARAAYMVRTDPMTADKALYGGGPGGALGAAIAGLIVYFWDLDKEIEVMLATVLTVGMGYLGGALGAYLGPRNQLK